jgi:hypothetical protein
MYYGIRYFNDWLCIAHVTVTSSCTSSTQIYGQFCIAKLGMKFSREMQADYSLRRISK